MLKSIFELSVGAIAFWASAQVYDIYFKDRVHRRVKKTLEPYLANIFAKIDLELPERLLNLDENQLKLWLMSVIESEVPKYVWMPMEEQAEAIAIVESEYRPTKGAGKVEEVAEIEVE